MSEETIAPVLPVTGAATPPWSGRLPVVGVGLEGPAGMSPRGRRLLHAASTVVGSERQLTLVDAAADTRAIVWSGRLADLLVRLTGLSGETTVLLASGDPNLFGVGATLATRFGASSVDIEPAVSSVQLALARAGVPIESTALLSVVGRQLTALGPARFARRIAVLVDRDNTPEAVAQWLLRNGFERDANAVVAERLGGADECVRHGSLGALPPGPHDPLSVLVVERPAAEGPGIGYDEARYEHRDGQVTKAEVRAVTLAALDVAADDVVWDIGAGCGSVAIEAARLARSGAVYAVERDTDQVALLRINVAAHGSWNVEVVEGEALDVCDSLPDPDAVFIGGGGRDLPDIIQRAIAALRRRRAVSPGRLVANLATLESVVAATEILPAAGLSWRVSQLQVARGRDVGGRLGFAALNPVFVVSAEVPRR